MSSVFNHTIPFSESGVSIIVLAAGASSRLGQPKQLIETKDDQPLIVDLLEKALYAKCESVIVVLGSTVELIRPKISHLPVHQVFNSRWREGVGSSVSAGIRALMEGHPKANGALFLLCDQPLVSAGLMREMLKKFGKTEKPLVACRYGGTVGVPALFGKQFFPELADLQGYQGAKKIILKHQSEAEWIDFPEGVFDIDTKEDLKIWKGKN